MARKSQVRIGAGRHVLLYGEPYRSVCMVQGDLYITTSPAVSALTDSHVVCCNNRRVERERGHLWFFFGCTTQISPILTRKSERTGQ